MDPFASKYTWYATDSGAKLHFIPAADNDPGSDLSGLPFWDEAVEDGGKDGQAICGAKTRFYAPGIFSRLARPRCRHCCKRLVIPEGDGAPFNDDDLRGQDYLAR